MVEIALNYSRTLTTVVDAGVFFQHQLWHYTWYSINGQACAAVDVRPTDINEPPKPFDTTSREWMAYGKQPVQPSLLDPSSYVWMAMHALVLGLTMNEKVTRSLIAMHSTSVPCNSCILN